MMKKGNYAFLAVFIVFAMLIISCGPEEAWEPTETLPELTSLKITSGNKIINVTNLGKPNKDPASAELVAGSATLYVKTEGGPYIVTAPVITASTTSASVVAKFGYAVTSNPPGDYSENAPAQLADGSSLWIQVTDTEENLSVYYVIKIAVKYNPVDEFAIKNYPVSREYTLADWNAAGSAQTLTVEMVDSSYTGYQYQWYINTVPLNIGGTAINGATQASYTPVITAVGTYIYYAAVSLDETLTTPPVVIRIVDTITPAPLEFKIGNARRNYVRGVGGTGSFMFRTGNNADASPDADVKYIEMLFGDLGANILRIMVQDEYLNYIDNKVQSRNQDKFFHDARRNFFAVIRKANEYGGYVFANPWTALQSMKVKDAGGTNPSETLAGGYLREDPSNYVDYAEHLRDFLKWLNTNNAPIFALGILNEPDFGGGANYEGMGMSANVTRDWFKTVGNFTTEKVTNRSSAGITSSVFAEDIIPGFGGGGPTHHVLAMSGDSMGNIAAYMDPQIDDGVSNNKIELMGRHYYSANNRYTKVVGTDATEWFSRPQLNYVGPHEAASIAQSPQMYAPGSKAGSIKREVWQTEHDFNFTGNSTTPPASNPQRYWNSAFAMLHDIDWCLRVAGESVFDWWYSSSYSGLVTSYQEAGFPPYTITPRGRAFAHYARYVNETWFLPINRTRGDITFNRTGSNASPNFDAGAVDPKISAFEDVNGKFISVVMYTPSYSTAGANGGTIGSGYGAGGTNGRDDPTRGSRNVGRIAIVLPDGFIGSGASAIRTYGNGNATADDAGWTAASPVPAGNPRYWIDEPVFLSTDGKSVEVTLPAGNVISIMVKGSWTGSREFASPERVRPYNVN